jgi:hypothetical protein
MPNFALDHQIPPLINRAVNVEADGGWLSSLTRNLPWRLSLKHLHQDDGIVYLPRPELHWRWLSLSKGQAYTKEFLFERPT